MQNAELLPCAEAIHWHNWLIAQSCWRVSCWGDKRVNGFDLNCFWINWMLSLASSGSAIPMTGVGRVRDAWSRNSLSRHNNGLLPWATPSAYRDLGRAGSSWWSCPQWDLHSNGPLKPFVPRRRSRPSLSWLSPGVTILFSASTGSELLS